MTRSGTCSLNRNRGSVRLFVHWLGLAVLPNRTEEPMIFLNRQPYSRTDNQELTTLLTDCGDYNWRTVRSLELGHARTEDYRCSFLCSSSPKTPPTVRFQTEKPTEDLQDSKSNCLAIVIQKNFIKKKFPVGRFRTSCVYRSYCCNKCQFSN